MLPGLDCQTVDGTDYPCLDVICRLSPRRLMPPTTALSTASTAATTAATATAATTATAAATGTSTAAATMKVGIADDETASHKAFDVVDLSPLNKWGTLCVNQDLDGVRIYDDVVLLGFFLHS